MYNDVHQLIPSSARGKHAYQGSLTVSTIKPRDVGHTGGELSGTAQSDIVTGEIGDAITHGNPSSDNGDDIYGPPTSPPPTPSPSKVSKRRFSALESVDLSQSAVGASDSLSTPTGSGMSARSPLSAKRGKMTGAIAISSLGHQISHLNDILHLEIEQNKTQAKSREEWKRQEAERQEQIRLERKELQERKELLERKRMERKRMEHECLEP